MGSHAAQSLGCLLAGALALAAWLPAQDASTAATPGLVRLAGHEGEVKGVAFGADGKLYSAGRDGTLRIWSVRESRQIGELQLERPIKGGWLDLAISADGSKLAATGGRGGVYLWKTADGGLLAQWQVQGVRPACLALRADGGAVALGDQDGLVVVCDDRGQGRVDLTGHAKNILALAWSHAGAGLASGDSDGVVTLWDVAQGKAARTFKPQDWFIGGLAWSPDDQQLATCSKNRKVRIHAVASDAEDPDAKPLHEMDGDTKLYAVEFGRAGRLIASGGRQDYVRVWRVQDGALVATLSDPQPDEQRGLTRIAVSPDGEYLATAHIDGIVRVWPMPKVD